MTAAHGAIIGLLWSTFAVVGIYSLRDFDGAQDLPTPAAKLLGPALGLLFIVAVTVTCYFVA